jgi:hypothetical protein
LVLLLGFAVWFAFDFVRLSRALIGNSFGVREVAVIALDLVILTVLSNSIYLLMVGSYLALFGLTSTVTGAPTGRGNSREPSSIATCQSQ